MQLSLAVRAHRRPRLQKLRQWRFKSSTPGPLEARHRTTRRKYGGAASSLTHRSGRDDIVPYLGSNLGTPSPSVRPRPLSPDTSSATGNDVPLPSWLRGALKELEVARANLDPPNPDKWKEKLSSCRTTYDIEQLAKRREVSFSDNKVSRYAFEHLCRLPNSIDEVLQFLGQRNLNPPAASNLAYFLRTLHATAPDEQEHRTQFRKVAHRLSRWLKEETVTGNLVEQEIRDVARWCTNNSPQESWHLRAVRVPALTAVVKGTLYSTIRSPHQLQRPTVRCLLRALASLEHRKVHAKILTSASQLIRSASNGSPSQAVQYLHTYLRYFLGRNNDSSKFRHCWHLVHSTADATAAMLSVEDVGPENLWLRFYLTHQDSLHDMPLPTWQAACLKLRPVVDHLVLQARSPTICAFLDAMGAADGAKLLFDHWVLQELGSLLHYPIMANDRVYDSPKALKEGLVDYMQAFPKQRGLDPYLGLLMFAKAVSNPLAEKLLDRLIRTFAAAPRLAMAYSLSRHAGKLGITLHPATSATLVNELAAAYPSQALELFLSEPALRIENCLPLAAAIIATPSIQTETALKLLSRSTYRRDMSNGLHVSNQRLLAFGNALAEMLAASDCTAAAKLALASRLAAMCDEYNSGAVGASATWSVLRAEVLNQYARGDRPSEKARAEVLARVARTEGLDERAKLEHIMNAWESMAAPLEGNFAPRSSQLPGEGNAGK